MQEPKMNILKILGKVIGIFLLIFILIVVVVWAYFNFILHSYNDSKYNFILKDQRGWYTIPKKEGVYYSLGTTDNKTNSVISFFGLIPIEHFNYKNDISEDLKKFCNHAAGTDGYKIIDNLNTSVNNLKGFVCISEGTAVNVGTIYILKEYILLNKPGSKYDYIITVTYPKGNMEEESKVNNILNSFYAK